MSQDEKQGEKGEKKGEKAESEPEPLKPLPPVMLPEDWVIRVPTKSGMVTKNLGRGPIYVYTENATVTSTASVTGTTATWAPRTDTGFPGIQPMTPAKIEEARSRGLKVVERFDVELEAAQNPFDVWDTMFGQESDGELQLWRKLPEPIVNKRGIPVGVEELISENLRNLREMLPVIREFILLDAYFTVNLFYPGAQHWRHPQTGMRVMKRTEKCLQNLVAAYVDLDVGRAAEDARIPEQRMTWRQAAAIAGDYMDAELLPQATFFARSGRGVYCIWCLRDEHDRDKLIRLPPPFPGAEGEERARLLGVYKRINKEFGERLRCAAADRIHDASRYLRLPGSIHSKTRQRVIWQLQTVDGKIPLYTMRELANWAGLTRTELITPALPYEIQTSEPRLLTGEIEPEKQVRKTKNPGSAPQKKAGQKRLGLNRVHDIETIEGYRFGFDQGFRSGTLLRYADALRIAGYTKAEIESRLAEMGLRCNPPYPSDANDTPISEIVKDAFKESRKYLTKNLTSWFQVTPELARELNLISIIPPEVRDERKLTRVKQASVIQRRRQLMQELITAANGKLPALRRLVDLLARYGYIVNKDTVRGDLKALGYKLRSPGRPNKGELLAFD